MKTSPCVINYLVNARDRVTAGALGEILDQFNGVLSGSFAGHHRYYQPTLRRQRHVVPLVAEVLVSKMAKGVEVAVIPVDSELTTQLAENVLNVLHPYLVKLLDSGQIPFRRVGAHRRVKVQDLLGYKQRSEAQSKAALEELASESQKHGLGY